MLPFGRRAEEAQIGGAAGQLLLYFGSRKVEKNIRENSLDPRDGEVADFDAID